MRLSITLRGAELCDGILILTCKLPFSQQMMHFLGSFMNQRWKFYFALKSLIGKDSKKPYRELNNFLNFMEMKRLGSSYQNRVKQ